jgi:hypothetical protein
MGIVYLGVHPQREKEGYLFNETLLLEMPNALSPGRRKKNPAAGAIRLVELKGGTRKVFLHTDIMAQKGLAFQNEA